MILIEASQSHDQPWMLDLRFPYCKPAIAQLKIMPGVTCERVGGPDPWLWRAPVDAIGIVGEILREAEVAKIKMAEPVIADLYVTLDSNLRSYQLEGVVRCVAGLRGEGAFLLADDMGLGKSAQALAAMAQVAQGPTVIICPASVVTSWAAQIRKWRPGDQYDAITKPKHVKRWTSGEAAFTPPGPQWVIVSYERACQLIKAGAVGPGWSCVLDEIHYVKDPRTARAKTIRQFVMAVRASGGATLGLSGTPVTVRPRDLHNVLDLLWPDRFGSFFDFGRRYCGGKRVPIDRVKTEDGSPKMVWDFDGSSREGELAQRLTHCMLRRTKGEVAKDLPALTRICREVELPAAACKGLRSAIALTAWESTAGPGRDQIAKGLLSQAEAYKIDAAIELAQEVIASGSRPLIICHRRGTAREISRRLGCPIVTGETDQDQRLAVLTSQAEGPAVATIRSIGTGLDGLQQAFDCQIHVGLGYRPSDMMQCEARIHRLGQLLPVMIYYLIGMGSIDEAVREIVIDRLETFNALLSAGADGTSEAEMASGLRGRDEDIMAALYARIDRMI